MKSNKILIADDQLLIRESLQVILDAEDDFEVIGLAENGRIAYEMCEQFQPDIVLMDIHMPEMDGIEATKKIKQLWRHIHVIILTTFRDTAYMEQAIENGAATFLLKAIDPQELVTSIRKVIGK